VLECFEYTFGLLFVGDRRFKPADGNGQFVVQDDPARIEALADESEQILC
jgi:hypothetical protein